MKLKKWEQYRTSLEWVGPITITRDGVPTTDFEVAVKAVGVEPTDSDFSTAYVLDGGGGILVGPTSGHVLKPGEYLVWARVQDAPERPVLPVVALSIT